MKNRIETYKVDAFVGENVKTCRELLGLKRKEVADILHIEDDTLYRIEKGQIGLSSIYSNILATELNFDMDFIYGRRDVPNLMVEEKNGVDVDEITRRIYYYVELLKSYGKK